MPIGAFIVYAASILNILGAFLNVFKWVIFLVLDLVICLCTGSVSYNVTFLRGFPLQGSHGAVALVWLLLFFQFSLLVIFRFLV